MAWQKVCRLDEIAPLGARVVALAGEKIAVFRTDGDDVFALRDACPHQGGPLSQGIVYGSGEHARVTCPLHGMNIALASGLALPPDEGCARRFPVRVEAGEVWLDPSAPAGT
ncbi:MAG: nitrite reductase small subunit NirD [Rhodocyclaceae bacterium]|nr:nitrite reductase small subunit NirD [Rhodocyclaceae bacterium]